MNELAAMDAHGTLTEDATLTMRRLLPGPIERVWDYLTKSELRRRWLAAGEMTSTVGAPFELVWRNDELSSDLDGRPAEFPAEHRMQSRIVEFDPPRRLAFEWGSTGGVSFELEPKGEDVLLTLVHRRIADPSMRLNISAGWHAHLDVLEAEMAGGPKPAFWRAWLALKDEYAQRLA